MYCPDCGAESTERRNYCKQCGGALNASSNITDRGAPSKQHALTWVIASLTMLFGVGGLAAVFRAAYDLAHQPGLDEGIPIVLMVFGSTSVVAVVALLVFLTLKLADSSRGAQSAGPKVIARRETSPQLPAPAAVVGSSVTEHTTRTFEPVERESSANE